METIPPTMDAVDFRRFGPRLAQKTSKNGARAAPAPACDLSHFRTPRRWPKLALTIRDHFEEPVMPINPTPPTNWDKVAKVISVSALAAMAVGAIVLPLLGVIAGMAFAG
jgi:hypothetical protein